MLSLLFALSLAGASSPFTHHLETIAAIGRSRLVWPNIFGFRSIEWIGPRDGDQMYRIRAPHGEPIMKRIKIVAGQRLGEAPITPDRPDFINARVGMIRSERTYEVRVRHVSIKDRPDVSTPEVIEVRDVTPKPKPWTRLNWACQRYLARRRR